MTADEAQRITHSLLLHGEVRADVSHGPTLAQRRVLPLFGREAFEQRGGSGSLENVRQSRAILGSRGQTRGV